MRILKEWVRRESEIHDVNQFNVKRKEICAIILSSGIKEPIPQRVIVCREVNFTVIAITMIKLWMLRVLLLCYWLSCVRGTLSKWMKCANTVYVFMWTR